MNEALITYTWTVVESQHLFSKQPTIRFGDVLTPFHDLQLQAVQVMTYALYNNITLQVESTTAVQDTFFCAAFNTFSMRSANIIKLSGGSRNSLVSTVKYIVDIQWFDRRLFFMLSTLLQSIQSTLLFQFHFFSFLQRNSMATIRRLLQLVVRYILHTYVS